MTSTDTGNNPGINPNGPFSWQMSFDMADFDNNSSTFSPAIPGPPYVPGFPYLIPWDLNYLGYSSLSGYGFDDTSGSSGDFSIFGDPATEKGNASATVTFTWVPDAGKDLTSDPPPQGPVYLLEQAIAEGYSDGSGSPAGGFDGSGTSADDGLGDKSVENSTDTSQWTDLVSRGKHLVQRDGSSGTITMSGSPTATGSGTVSGAGGYAPVLSQAGVGYSVALDSRAVSISSSLGQTHSRSSGPPYQQVTNTLIDGTLTDDTVAPDTRTYGDRGPAPSVSIGYSATYAGGWGANSAYKWYSSMTAEIGSGTFPSGTPNPIPFVPFVGTSLVYYNAPASPGAQEHVYVHLTDSNGGANATANCYVNFHNKYEDWKRVSSTVYPRSVDTHIEDWSLLYTIDNYSATPVSQTQDKTVTVKTTMKGSIGIDANTPALKDIFSSKESIELGKEETQDYKQGTTYTAPPWTRMSYYAAMSYEDRTGTCSVWGSDGYDGEATWTGTYSSGIASFAPHTDEVYLPKK